MAVNTEQEAVQGMDVQGNPSAWSQAKQKAAKHHAQQAGASYWALVRTLFLQCGGKPLSGVAGTGMRLESAEPVPGLKVGYPILDERGGYSPRAGRVDD